MKYELIDNDGTVCGYIHANSKEEAINLIYAELGTLVGPNPPYSESEVKAANEATARGDA